MERASKVIGYSIIKFFNMVVGVLIALAGGVVVLSFCLVDLILLLLPIFFVCQMIVEGVTFINTIIYKKDITKCFIFYTDLV